MAVLTLTWPPSATAPGEPSINLKATQTFLIEGNAANPGDTFTAPLRLGLGIVGNSSAVQQ